MLKSIGSTWGLTLVTIAVTYVLMPFTIHTLGNGTYGTWLLVSSMTGYLNLLVLGAPMASVRQFATSIAAGDEDELKTAIASVTALLLVLGLAALVVGAAMFAVFVKSYSVPDAIRSDAYIAFGIVVFQYATSFVMQVPYGLLAAHGDFVRRNAITTVALIVRLVLTLGLLRLIPSLRTLALIQLAIAIAECAGLLLLIRRAYPGTRFELSRASMSTIRSLATFSAYVLLLNLAAQLTFQSDSLVIGRYLTVSDIPFYNVANSLTVNLMAFVIAIAGVVMPEVTRMHAQGNTGAVRDLFLKWSKIAFLLTVTASAFLLVCGADFVAWWVGPEFRGPTGNVLSTLTLSSILFLPMRGVALPVLMGLGKPRNPTLAFLLAGVLNLAISIALARPLGLQGVALGTAIPNALVSIAIVGFACHELDISILDYVRYVGLKVAIAGGLGAGALVAFRAVVTTESLPSLAAAGMLLLAITSPLALFFVFRNDPLVVLPKRLQFARPGQK